MSDLITQPATEVPGAVFDVLARSAPFDALPHPAAQEVASRSSLRVVRRGERLWTHGEPSAGIAIVATGRVKCWSPGRDSRQWVNTVVRGGGICGLAACLDAGPYSCNAEPLERSRVVLVPASTVRSAMERSPPFARAVADLLARDVRRLLAVCEDVALHTPVERLARFLVTESAGRDTIELSETQTQIAAQLGTVREVVGRGLRQLESRGVISRAGRVVSVLRARELERIAGCAGGGGDG